MRSAIIVLALWFAPFVAAAEKFKVSIPDHLQEISVTITTDRGEGSGVIKTRDGVNYIWTAAHVVESLRRERRVIDPGSGTPRVIVEFGDAQIVKTLIEDGRTVGRLSLDAEVVRYSNVDDGEDLALLRLRKKNFISSSVRFYLEEEIPPLGTRLYHVGSLLGQMGANSMTDGIMSQHGRLIKKREFDQATVVAFPGSSGGGVYLTDGRYMGMLVRGTQQQGFNLVVPVRRMRAWAKRANVEWAIDDNVKVPSEADLKALPIEDIGKDFAKGKEK